MTNDPQTELREAFRAVGDEFIKAFEQADRMARAACDDIRKIVTDAPAARADAAPEHAEASPAEAIRSLAALRDEGLITDAEFEAKKSELLARI
jgi:hypothetical protein